MSQYYNKKAILANNVPSMSNRKKNYSISPDTVKCKKVGNYLLSNTIGKGTFSKVKLGIHLPTQKKVAIKILDKEKIKDESDLERISREIHILTVLRHPNIAQLYETITSERHIYIIMEYVEGHDLFQYIYSLQRLSELKSSQLFRQLISTLEYIHTLGIVHRDIKPENILLNKQKTILKLVDFGLSNSYKHGDLLKTACGSPCYAAPEMISGKEYDGLYSDLWSCGVVLYCMLVGKLPFDDEDIKVLYYNIKSANYFLPPFLSNISQDLIRRILTTNPKRRISLEEIKQHPFFLIGERTPLMKGLLIGVENIPVDWDIIKEIKKKYFHDKESVNEQYIANMIQKNIHNNTTTIYYLMCKEKTENIFNEENSKIKKIKKEKIRKKNSSKEKKDDFNYKLKEIFTHISKNTRNNKNYDEETISEINNNIKIITPNNECGDSTSRTNIEIKKSDKFFNLSTIKKISFENNKSSKDNNNMEQKEVTNINNINNFNNIKNINNINNKNSEKPNNFNVLVINNFMSEQQSQNNNSKNKNNSNILTINIGGGSSDNKSNSNTNNNENMNINDLIINKLQKRRSNSRNSKRLTNINYNYKKNKTESLLGQTDIVKNKNIMYINSNNNENELNTDKTNKNENKKTENINCGYKKLNTFKSFKDCNKYILNSPDNTVLNDENNKTLNINKNNVNTGSNNIKYINIKENNKDKNQLKKKYLIKLFDEENNDNVSYTENNQLYLSSIAGNNVYNNKSINLNYNDISSNEIKNKNTNNKINIKYLKKLEKEKSLNKSTNTEEKAPHILQSDYRSIKNNYINEESKLKNINIIHKENNNDILSDVKSISLKQKSKIKTANSSNKRQGYININNNINILNKMNNHINSRSKKRKKSGLEEKLTKIFKERFSVSLKKNNSKGKEPYLKTGGAHIGAYSITKAKSPTSYSHEKGEINSANYKIYGGINNKKIKQNYLIGINNKYINQKFGNNNYNIINSNNLNLIKTFNNNMNTNLNNINNINNLNQKPVATPMNKTNLNKKMSIGFPVNFSNVKRKILSKEKNRNNNINNIINNLNGISNKFSSNKVEIISTHHSKEKNHGTLKSNSLNKKNHHQLKNKSSKNKNNNIININSINLNSKSKSKTKRTPMTINLKK